MELLKRAAFKRCRQCLAVPHSERWAQVMTCACIWLPLAEVR